MKALMRRDLDDSILTDGDFLVVDRAILMNPSEVHEYTYSYTKEVRKLLRGSWTLGGVVCGERFAKLKADMHDGLFHRVSTVTSETGAAYVVISTQLEEWQHRFLLPLFVGKAVSLVAADSTKALSLNFSSTDGDDGFVFLREAVPASEYPVLLARNLGVQDQRIAQDIAEMSSVVREVFNPSFVPSMSQAHAVSAVEVSFLMPWQGELEAYLQGEELEATQ